MTDKIISLHGDPIVTDGPVEAVVDALERALEKARNGELATVAICALHKSGRSWSVTANTKEQAFAMLGVMTIAIKDFTEEFNSTCAGCEEGHHD